MISLLRVPATFVALFFLFSAATVSAQTPVIQPGDHVAYIGNTLADRMQHDGWLESYIHALHPDYDLTFRNLGYSADEVKTRPRADNFGSPDQWLEKVSADVIFCFFGYNEALRGEEGLEQFREEFAEMLDGMLSHKYNGESAPRIVVFSPIANEDLDDPNLPDPAEKNRNLKLYSDAMAEISAEKGVRFVDIYGPSVELYESSEEPLTMNSIHLLPRGNKALAQVIIRRLFGASAGSVSEERLEEIRQAVLDKNYEWFSRYRVIDEYNVFGGRSKLEWFGQSNADVMMREMEIFDVKTANRDKRVWAVAKGGDLEVVDDNLPSLVPVRTNKPGPLPDESFPYLGGEEAISKMDVHEGVEVNLFASEEMFPRLINPVQMAVDSDSRLWVSVWPSYPHWNPTEPRRDAIIILPDENQDGVADECIVFADELNSVTGFEFWGGGVLVAAPPEIWFLKDTDGDDRADYKLRMLQGLSSADTHHSANAMLIGPDGWLYWSRGVFNVANFETPTKTYRSGTTGVHRLNPRTFEVEFHYPIGPNPHGDVFDQWGYQFANDGTSGTGGYVNIGRGQRPGNKQWFKMDWRPVAATGILSSSHFPEEMQGNFLICNTIGFLGVLNYEVQYDGAQITAVRTDDLLRSSDENFRPSDIEVGGDGALYVADWHNVLIGHMQHNMRDPNRDHEHGRIYRLTATGRPLLEPLKLKGKPIEEVLAAFYAKENSSRYRARLELSGRETEDVVEAIAAWTAERDVSNPDDAQAMLECLWVLEEHRSPDGELVLRVFGAEEPRVRAAAIRTLGHWATQLDNVDALLLTAARDESALVRAEAVKAAALTPGLAAAEVIFEVANRPTDPELIDVLNYAKSQIDVDAMIREAVASGKSLSPAAHEYALQNAAPEDLLKLGRSAEVFAAIVSRPTAPLEPLQTAIAGLAQLRGKLPVDVALDLIEARDDPEGVDNLGRALARMPSDQLRSARARIETLAAEGETAEARRVAYVALIVADAGAANAMFVASQSKASLEDFLAAVPMIEDDALRAALYDDVRSLMFELPPNLDPETGADGVSQPGVLVEYFSPAGDNVAVETLEALEPQARGVADRIGLGLPEQLSDDDFALRFTGMLTIEQPGRYRFFVNSDDGSRIYIDDKLLVDNDGAHGMAEKGENIELAAGLHKIVVTYFDDGGSDGLSVSWATRGMRKRELTGDDLTVGGGETLHDRAVRTLASIPGREAEKFADLVTLFKAGRSREAAISVLATIPVEDWTAAEVRPLIDNLIGYLTTVPAAGRNSGAPAQAMELARAAAATLDADVAAAIGERLENLDVRIIAIGTVPTRMIFDKEQIAVQAGRPVEFRFSNSDHMPHNFAIVQPGALAEVGMLAEATAQDEDAAQRQYIPDSDKILLASNLLQPEQSESLIFEAPTEPGVYPYVCTYPGHWRRMHGALYVVDDLEQYLAGPEQYLAAHPLPIRDELLTFIGRNTEWRYDDVFAAASPLPSGRSFEVGMELFTAANCVACHKLNGVGQEIGPDLAALDADKQKLEHIIRSMLEPSHTIDEKYRSTTLILTSGRTVTGLITEETGDAVKILLDPLAKAPPLEIAKGDIEERIPSTTSIMPQGLLDRLTLEEILDLVALVHAGGKSDHAAYAEGHEHQH